MFGEKILDYWDDILSDLGKLVAIPSVAVRSETGKPFGDQCAKAIDTVVEMAEGYGLAAKNVDYYAAHAEYGGARATPSSWRTWTWSPPGRAGTPTPSPW